MGNIIIIFLQNVQMKLKMGIIAIIHRLKQWIDAMEIVKHAYKDQLNQIILVKHAKMKEQNILILEIVKKRMTVLMEFL